jgi:hypothetical protein
MIRTLSYSSVLLGHNILRFLDGLGVPVASGSVLFSFYSETFHFL